MAKFEDYANRYNNIRMERHDGILQITFHTNGGPLQWSLPAHTEFTYAFSDIANDRENKIVIMTGAGDAFSGPQAKPQTNSIKASDWDPLYWEGKRLLWNLLDIEAPMIAAINGPALRHSELPLLCDIVLCTDTTTFQDSAHFISGMTPGDGMHVVYPLLMGLNRGRYFLLTGQTLSAQQAQELGLVNEVLPVNQLLPRAWELAKQLEQKPPLVLRYTRVLLTQYLKRELHDLLGYGLALEGLGMADERMKKGFPWK